MSKYISITQDVEEYLNITALKDEEGRREETPSEQLRRMLKIKER